MRRLFILVCLLFALVVMTGCSSAPKAADTQEWGQQIKVTMDALADAGLEADAYVFLESDKIGAIENRLTGPWNFKMMVVARARPKAVTDITGRVDGD